MVPKSQAWAWEKADKTLKLHYMIESGEELKA